MTPLVDLKKTKKNAGGIARISDCYACVVFVKCIAWHSLGALMYLKTKTQQRHHLSVFFSCFKKFKCLGDVLDSVTPITVCNIEVPSLRRFYNLAQILI